MDVFKEVLGELRKVVMKDPFIFVISLFVVVILNLIRAC